MTTVDTIDPKRMDIIASVLVRGCGNNSFQLAQWKQALNEYVTLVANTGIHSYLENANLSDERIDAIAESMPGGLNGFMKTWGCRQFARAVLKEVGID